MVLLSLISMVLFFLLNFFSLLQVTGSCENGEIVCERTPLNFITLKWCCPAAKICGETFEQCEMIHKIEPFTYLVIILSTIIIAIFFARCLIFCLNCRTVQTEPLSNHIYYSVVTTDSNIPIEEESPPSYEQVMNNNHSHQFENPR